MPNRRGRRVAQPAPFDPQPLLPEGLLPVARPSGKTAASLAEDNARLAGRLGSFADAAARIEGARAGKQAGLDPDFRPRGSTSIYGAAYEASAIRTYQDNLDARLRADLQSVYEANKDSPAALKAAFDKLGEEYESRHVFEQIRGDFRASITRLRLPYERGAARRLESEARDHSRAALIENIAISQTNAARAAAADPDSPVTGGVVMAELARIDELIDEAVAGGELTAVAAVKLKQSNRNEITTRAAVAQADALDSAEAVAEYRTNAKKQFAAGKFNGLDAEGFDRLDASLGQVERRKLVETNRGVTLLKKNIDDYVQRALDGFPVPAAEWTDYAGSDAAKTEAGAAVLEIGQRQLQIADAIRNRPIADGERVLQAMRAELRKDGAASEAQADLVRFAERALKEQRIALAKDPLGLAARKGVIAAPSPLDLDADPVALAAQIRARTAQARAVAETFERTPIYLRPEEGERLKGIVDAGGDKALALAGAIVKGADGDAPRMLAEMAGDAPLLAQAGSIIANGGSLAAARDALAARAIERESGKKLPSLKPAAASQVARTELGRAYRLSPEDGGRVQAAADAIARTRIQRAGVDPTGAEAETIYRRALQEAAGASFVDDVQFGGVASYRPGWFIDYRVVVPPAVQAERFRDVIRTLRDDDLAALAVPPEKSAGKPARARDLAGAVPIAVRGGYAFDRDPDGDDGSKWIYGRDGRPFVLPFDALAPELRRRRPDLFLGGR